MSDGGRGGRAGVTDIRIAVPSSACATGTQAMPIALPSRCEKRELVMRPAGSPLAPTTCVPSRGTLPFWPSQPTRASRLPRCLYHSIA